MLRRSTISGVLSSAFTRGEIERAEFVPFGEDHHAVGAVERVIGILAEVEVQMLRRLPCAPSGSKARMVAPACPADTGTMTRLGASRMSSVLGLKVRPSTAMVLPFTPPKARFDLLGHLPSCARH